MIEDAWGSSPLKKDFNNTLVLQEGTSSSFQEILDKVTPKTEIDTPPKTPKHLSSITLSSKHLLPSDMDSLSQKIQKQNIDILFFKHNNYMF